MKVGTIKVKRNYLIAQMVVDAVAVILLVVIFECTLSFGEFIDSQNALIEAAGTEAKLIVWQWNLVWFIAAVLVTLFSLFLTYKNRKLPAKYRINSKNAQKYNDIIITAISCIRIPVLLAIFDMMYIHQKLMTYQNDSLFSVQILLDIVLTVIIIRFSIHRIRAIEPPEEEKSHEIIEG